MKVDNVIDCDGKISQTLESFVSSRSVARINARQYLPLTRRIGIWRVYRTIVVVCCFTITFAAKSSEIEVVLRRAALMMVVREKAGAPQGQRRSRSRCCIVASCWNWNFTTINAEVNILTALIDFRRPSQML